MFNAIRKTEKSDDTTNSIGMFIADKGDMADNRNNQPHVWDGNHSSIRAFVRRLFSSFNFKHTTLYKNDMYQIPLFAKITIAFIAGIETFLVQNIYVQWIVTVYILMGGGLWVYSNYLSVEKKNLIFTNISIERTKRGMKMAKSSHLQLNINKIILRCFIVAAILVILFIISH